MFLDTTVLIELVRRTADDPVRRRIEEELRGHPLLACSIQLGEVADYHRRTSTPADVALGFIRRLVDIVPVDEATAILASELKGEARRHRAGKNFSLIDGVALAAARIRGQGLLTMARDFAMFDDVRRVRAPD
jgi:predicted nucleic acid-binding protein